MNNKIPLIIILFIVFFIGFLSGSLWQTLLQNLRQIPVEQSVLVKSEKPVEPKRDDLPKTPTMPKTSAEEETISQALSDPDFKKVHDFLIREKPIQMNIEYKK